MPKRLEEKLKKEYGKDSDIPYKVMNKLGFMHGNKETAKGKRVDMIKKISEKTRRSESEHPETSRVYKSLRTL